MDPRQHCFQKREKLKAAEEKSKIVKPSTGTLNFSQRFHILVCTETNLAFTVDRVHISGQVLFRLVGEGHFLQGPDFVGLFLPSELGEMILQNVVQHTHDRSTGD